MDLHAGDSAGCLKLWIGLSAVLTDVKRSAPWSDAHRASLGCDLHSILKQMSAAAIIRGGEMKPFVRRRLAAVAIQPSRMPSPFASEFLQKPAAAVVSAAAQNHRNV